MRENTSVHDFMPNVAGSDLVEPNVGAALKVLPRFWSSLKQMKEQRDEGTRDAIFCLKKSNKFPVSSWKNNIPPEVVE